MNDLLRVLIVDDSSLVRRVLSKLLTEEPDFEVVGVARDGQQAIEQVEALQPDVVTMDVEMPVMNGVEAVKRIRLTHRDLPIIMFSSLTERGSRATIDSLVAGATGYVNKRNRGDGLKALVQDELAPRLREVTRNVRSRSASMPSSADEHPTLVALPHSQTSRLAGRPRALVIGSSTGGPAALATVLPSLPGNLGVPVLVVQHMPPRFTALLAERLDGMCALNVREGADGEPVLPDTVYIAPGGYHMRVVGPAVRPVIALDQQPPVNSCRPAVDHLFRSAVNVFGGRLLAVVLTGMGQDGRDGAMAVRQAGGSVLAQDESSSVVWGMPRAVTEAGIVDDVLDIHQVASAVIARVTGPQLVGRSVSGRR